MTEAQYRIHLMRTAAQHNAQLMGAVALEPESGVGNGVDDESDLHEQIHQECRKRGWLAFHGAMSHRTYRTTGEPDWLVLGDSGRFWMVECKSRTGKLSPAQRAVAAHAANLHQPYYVVRSLEDFLRIVDNQGTNYADQTTKTNPADQRTVAPGEILRPLPLHQPPEPGG